MQQHLQSKPARPAPRWPLIAFALALSLSSAVAAATGEAAKGKAPKRADSPKDNRVWLLARTDETTSLRFGAPGIGDPVFAVACQPGAGLLQFTVEVASTKIRSGDGVALSLAAGKRRLELAASTFRGATDGLVVAEAAVSLEDRVLDLFADGETLTVRAPGTTASFPLAGARAKLPDFRKGCLTRR
ncbi:hypothetical protein V5F53_08170 [Xanthobacter sp. V4C-4]|uniref:hypothetical protein n=1 Tax=Xanthobacter cornucopiae TaxID=3119924 RepID=UPI0037292082